MFLFLGFKKCFHHFPGNNYEKLGLYILLFFDVFLITSIFSSFQIKHFLKLAVGLFGNNLIFNDFFVSRTWCFLGVFFCQKLFVNRF